MKEPTVTIPVRLELEYIMDNRRLIRQLEFYTIASLQKFNIRRQDSDGLLAFLSLSTPEILNERALRLRLRQLATQLTDEKIRELRALLGPGVRLPRAGLIDQWIEDQVTAIRFVVEQWTQTASQKILETRLAGESLASLAAEFSELAIQIRRQADSRASFRILQLNSNIIQEVARGAGSSHYRWKTEQDSRVRVNHQPLHDTIQSWDNPPSGGGTRPGDYGHPGSGYGCRCVPVPLQGRIPVTRLMEGAAAPVP